MRLHVTFLQYAYYINTTVCETNSKDLEDVTETNSKDPESNSEHESEPPEPEINKKTGTGSKALTSSSNCLLSILPSRSQSVMSSRSKY